MKRVQIIFKVVMILFSFSLTSCNKEPGTGGTATIEGTIHTTKYNTSFNTILGSYNSGNEWVYIIYGDDISYGDRILTSAEGKFAFQYLCRGNYTIYVYSQDVTLSGQHAVSKTIEITSTKQHLNTGIYEIKKK